MSSSTRVGLLAGATALTLTGVSHAGPASNDDLAQRLAAAEAKIAAMEASSNQDWLTEQRAAEIKGLVQDVLADADTRSSLMQGGATSGYDNGFILSSTDGNWLLRLNFLMQQRFIYNNQDDLSAGDGDSNRWGFENTRSTLILSGHVVNPSWFYRLDVNFGSNSVSGLSWSDFNGGSDDREDTLNAYLGYDYGNGWRMRMGSMKLPFLHEELVEDQYQLGVERSVLNYMFTTGYSDALSAEWAGDRFRVEGSFSDGAQQSQTIWSNFDTEFAFSGRAEFLASGTWDQFRDFTSARGGETGILVGGAVHWEKGENPSPGDEAEILAFTVDAAAEFGGFNLYGAFVYSDLDVGPAGANPWGLVVQGGFYLTEDWELYARWEWIDFDDSFGTTFEDTMLLTLGVNKYFAGHNAKWSTDFGYGVDPVIFPADITGWRPDFADEEGQFVVRTQIQLFF